MSFCPVSLEPVRQLRSTKTWYSLLKGEAVNTVPPDAVPCTIYFISSPEPIYFYTSQSCSPLPTTSSSQEISIWPPATIPPFLAESKLFFQYLLGPADNLHIDTPGIANAIRSSSLLACSDGSFNPQSGQGSHGWVIASTKKQIFLQGTGPMSGHPELSSAYRAELSGLISILYLLSRICNYHNVTTGQITIYCDSKSALQSVFHKTYQGITPVLFTDFDLITVAHLAGSSGAH
jgi:hypothetical protein